MSEYVGFDVSKEETAFCVKDGAGEILAQGKAETDPRALFEVLKEHCLCPDRIVLETGTLSGAARCCAVYCTRPPTMRSLTPRGRSQRAPS